MKMRAAATKMTIRFHHGGHEEHEDLIYYENLRALRVLRGDENFCPAIVKNHHHPKVPRHANS
jgi:hypothetical protein